jgi:hypothetical protein
VVRQRLGEMAADLARADGPKAKLKPAVKSAGKKKRVRAKKAALKAGVAQAKEDSISKSEFGVMLKALAADAKQGKHKPRNETAEKQLCRDWKRGKCTSGDRCNFEHGSTFDSPNGVQPLCSEGPGGTKGKFMAMMAEAYDGGDPFAVARSLKVACQTCSVRTMTRPTKGAQAPNSESGASKKEARVEKLLLLQGVSALAIKSKATKKRKSVKRRRRKYPVADTGANDHFVGTGDLDIASNVRAVDPVLVSRAHGDTVAAERAGLLFAMVLMRDGLVLPLCDELLCSVGKVCEDFDLGYKIDPGNSEAEFLIKRA